MAGASGCRASGETAEDAEAGSPALAVQVTVWMEEWRSPVEIANRLRLEFPDDPMMRVSHETIYMSLFVQGRGELCRRSPPWPWGFGLHLAAPPC